jgi:hypothetical protein
MSASATITLSAGWTRRTLVSMMEADSIGNIVRPLANLQLLLRFNLHFKLQNMYFIA